MIIIIRSGLRAVELVKHTVRNYPAEQHPVRNWSSFETLGYEMVVSKCTGFKPHTIGCFHIWGCMSLFGDGEWQSIIIAISKTATNIRE